MTKIYLHYIILFLAASFFVQPFLYAQPADSISEVKTRYLMNVLAGDSLRGRGDGSIDLLTAASFIGNRFQNAGLKPLYDSVGFYLPFPFMRKGEDPYTGDTYWNGVVPDSAAVQSRGPFYQFIGYNIVGVLPGRSRPKEVVIISAHYDHVGVSRKEPHDSIFNGANDNASGTAALLMLIDYYTNQNNNERTIIFCAFSGEEIGLFGSTHLAKYFLHDNIVAMVNLEMLGVPGYGKKRVFILGEGYSTLPDILGKELKKNGLKLVREPNPDKKLFFRSDNAPFARYGVPAHTIMASDDDDKCYHKPCDENDRIDMSNLAFITKAIAQACKVFINGDKKPSRVQASKLEWIGYGD